MRLATSGTLPPPQREDLRGLPLARPPDAVRSHSLLRKNPAGQSPAVDRPAYYSRCISGTQRHDPIAGDATLNDLPDVGVPRLECVAHRLL